MRVLNLVTFEDSRFYKQQVEGLERRGVECDTYSLPTNPTVTDDESDSRSPLDYARFYPAAIRRSFGDYDLLHANYGLTAPAAIAQPNLPVVLSLWGTDLMGKYGPVSKLCAEFCDAVIVMSEEMAAELDRDCYVIPHGVDLEKFSPMDQEAAQRELGWDPDVRQVLFPYPKRREVKDYPRARRVVDRAAEHFDDPIELQTVSGVPHDRMPLYMNAADVLLMTSKREGSPNAVKEAMACNLPVVSTDVGDVSDHLPAVEPSYVCRTDDELVDRLVEILEYGGRSNGREAARELSHERLTDRLLEVYNSVLEKDVASKHARKPRADGG